jgi:hypothetical protein
MKRARIGLVLVTAIALASCGGSTMPNTPSPGTPSAVPGPSNATATAITITRTGGIAGVNDVLEIAADGTGRMTRGGGQVISCSPMPAVLARLRAIDLGAVGTGMPKTPIADGFNYTVTSPLGTASAGDGDDGIRAELVSAAASVLASCESTPSGRRGPSDAGVATEA